MSNKYTGVGMTYSQAIKNGKRFAADRNTKLLKSITNQVILKEGIKAGQEFVKECSSQRLSRRYY
jgi:hypothetical protein